MRILAIACGFALLLASGVASAACEYQSAKSSETVAQGSAYPQSTPSNGTQPRG